MGAEEWRFTTAQTIEFNNKCEVTLVPFVSIVSQTERLLQFNKTSASLFQTFFLFVILNQFHQSGKLLSTVQVIMVARVLDLNVDHSILLPAKKMNCSHKCTNIKYIL